MTIEVFILPHSVPCERLQPELNRLKANFPEITLEYINVLDQPDYARVKRIKTIPTVCIKKDKLEIHRYEGWTSYESIISKMNIE